MGKIKKLTPQIKEHVYIGFEFSIDNREYTLVYAPYFLRFLFKVCSYLFVFLNTDKSHFASTNEFSYFESPVVNGFFSRIFTGINNNFPFLTIQKFLNGILVGEFGIFETNVGFFAIELNSNDDLNDVNGNIFINSYGAKKFSG